MSFIKFTNIGIKGISVATPKNIVKTIDQTKYFDKKKLQNFISTTGIEERRIAPSNVCASDLCYASALQLINSLSVPKDQIGALIFISQTPDYRTPATAALLQNRLELSTGIFAFDVNQACSGYIWGLFLAYSLVNSGLNNVLLLVGDTPSKISSINDSQTTLMFGDGGSASLITQNKIYGESFFSVNTDGSGFNAVNVPGGGFRKMSSIDTLTTKKYEDESEKNQEQLHMDGMDVFSFSTRALIKDVKQLLIFAEMQNSDIDKFVFHQANKYMNDVISKRLNADITKTLYSIQKFGNTSSCSIPITIVYQKELIKNKETILMTAIGAGFTWGSAILKLSDCTILELIEY